MSQYKTIKQSAQAEIIEKKSKFIANILPVTSQEEAEEELVKLRKKYFDATHNCFAYQIGLNNEIQRFSDDGEPKGTAGKPILDVLKGADVKNTLICVTRYFGGTLLGTGGLVRAYGKAAKEALKASGIVERKKVQIFELTMPYTLLGKIQYDLNENNYTIRDTIYTEKVVVFVEILDGNQQHFKKWIIENTNGEITPKGLHYDYVDFEYPL